jgi:hypothetical protein
LVPGSCKGSWFEKVETVVASGGIILALILLKSAFISAILWQKTVFLYASLRPLW